MIEGHHASFYYKLIDSSICVYAAENAGAMLKTYAISDINGKTHLDLDSFARQMIDNDYQSLQEMAQAQP